MWSFGPRSCTERSKIPIRTLETYLMPCRDLPDLAHPRPMVAALQRIEVRLHSMPQKPKISLKIDDVPVQVDCRNDDYGGGGAAGDSHPAALLPSRSEPGRLVPRLRGGREGHGLLHGGLQLAGLGRDGGADQLARNPPGPARHRRAADRQPQHGLPNLRTRRALRIAEPRLRDGRPGEAFRGQAKTLPAGNVERLGGARQRKMRPLRPLRPRLCRKSRASTT